MCSDVGVGGYCAESSPGIGQSCCCARGGTQGLLYPRRSAAELAWES